MILRGKLEHSHMANISKRLGLLHEAIHTKFPTNPLCHLAGPLGAQIIGLRYAHLHAQPAGQIIWTLEKKKKRRKPNFNFQITTLASRTANLTPIGYCRPRGSPHQLLSPNFFTDERRRRPHRHPHPRLPRTPRRRSSFSWVHAVGLDLHAVGRFSVQSMPPLVFQSTPLVLLHCSTTPIGSRHSLRSVA